MHADHRPPSPRLPLLLQPPPVRLGAGRPQGRRPGRGQEAGVRIPPNDGHAGKTSKTVSRSEINKIKLIIQIADLDWRAPPLDPVQVQPPSQGGLPLRDAGGGGGGGEVRARRGGD